MSFGIRVFDTILEDNAGDTVTRNSADFWRIFCQSSKWRFSYERVHSLDDLRFFFKKPIKENVIIFSGHGNKQDGYFLSNGQCFSGEEKKINIFKYKQKEPENNNFLILFDWEKPISCSEYAEIF